MVVLGEGDVGKEEDDDEENVSVTGSLTFQDIIKATSIRRRCNGNVWIDSVFILLGRDRAKVKLFFYIYWCPCLFIMSLNQMMSLNQTVL